MKQKQKFQIEIEVNFQNPLTWWTENDMNDFLKDRIRDSIINITKIKDITDKIS